MEFNLPYTRTSSESSLNLAYPCMRNCTYPENPLLVLAGNCSWCLQVLCKPRQADSLRITSKSTYLRTSLDTTACGKGIFTGLLSTSHNVAAKLSSTLSYATLKSFSFPRFMMLQISHACVHCVLMRISLN